MKVSPVILHTSRQHRIQWHTLTAITLLLLYVIIFTGCQTPAASPTATPTRTPIIPTSTPTLTPSLTPTPTPTNTPTPTPTLPPNLLLQPVAQTVSDWAVLPADLYFLRDGRINIWLAEGMHLEIPLLSEDNDASVHNYRVTPDGRYIAYVTSTGRLYRLDRATWEHTFIPTSGYLIEHDVALFNITQDGEEIFYLAWGTQPSSASSPRSNVPSGTILAMNTLNPQMKQQIIGYCQGADNIPCLDVSLSPDESQLAYLDGLGGWVAEITGDKPRFIAPHSGDSIYTKLSWSADGRWLLMQSDASYITLVDVTAVNSIPLTLTLCEQPCQAIPSWASDTLWFIVQETHQACLIEINPANVYAGDLNNQLNLINTICQIDSWELHPVSLQAFPNNRVFFLHQGCDKPCDGPTSGVYSLNSDNTIFPIALSECVDGSMLWTSDGSAFLFASASGEIRRVGLLNTPAYWDVTNLLRNAASFQWGEVTVVNE